MGQIVVPELSESVVEATVAEWLVNVGDSVSVGDVLVVLETDKVSLEVTAEEDGTISEIAAEEEEDVTAGQLLGTIDANGTASGDTHAAAADEKDETEESDEADKAKEKQPAAVQEVNAAKAADGLKVTPVARRMAEEHGINLREVTTSNGGKIDKADVQAFIDKQTNKQKSTAAAESKPAPKPEKPGKARELEPREEREKMSRRRRTIAKRLVEAQQTAAMLTTFNEVDMSAIIDVRTRRKEAFKEKHGVSLGFSSFFVKAVIGALKAFPRLNAEIDGDHMIIKDYYDIGIAVGSDEGLVVPVLRDADRMSFAEIESTIKDYAQQVRDRTLPLEALRGGTFTITNGGVFGSMLSTPILNYPQVGILGLHGIKERPVVIDGEIVIRPWMYLALTYDHRIVDGSDAVRFLVKVKDLIEDPETLLIEG